MKNGGGDAQTPQRSGAATTNTIVLESSGIVATVRQLPDRVPHPRREATSRRTCNFRRCAPRAFSLVEVVLAIGLATFALLVVFSLLPAGLRSLQEANRQIVETEIFNALGAELTSTKFDEVQAHVASRFPLYFDNEGLEVAGAQDATFIVRCLAQPLEGAGELRRTTVSIGFQRDPDAAGASPTRRTFLLVDRGL